MESTRIVAAHVSRCSRGIERACFAVALCLCSSSSHLAFAADQTVGSVASAGDMQLIVSDNGLVRPRTNDGGMVNDLWFGGEASATIFRFNDGAIRVFKAGGGYFDSGSPTAVTAISNTTVGNTVTTQYRLGAGVNDPIVSQVVTLDTAARSYDISWSVDVQVSGIPMSGLRIVYGGDTSLLGDDNGTGEWDAAFNAVSVLPLSIAGSGRVRLIGITAPSAYQANNQAQVRLSGSNTNLNNGISSTTTDIAMAMQWNVGSINAGASATVQARVIYGLSEQTPTPTPTNTPTRTPTRTATPTATWTPTPTLAPQQTPTPLPEPEPEPLPSDTISGTVRDLQGVPLSGVLVYALRLGADRTDSNGAFAIQGGEGDTDYTLRIQRVGFDFSGAPTEAKPGDQLSIVGTATRYNPAVCRENDVSLALSDAAGFAREVWTQGQQDSLRLGGGAADALEAINVAFDAYLERSSEFPEVLLKCAKARSAGYTRRSLAREKRLMKRAIVVLGRGAFLANRRLREEGSRTSRESVRVKKTIDRATSRATRLVNRLSRYTFQVR